MSQAPVLPFEGVLLIDKPAGITSHDVVDRVRRKLKMKRVGHAGTLDPAATGLMIVLVGKATKLSQHLMNMSKVYEGTIKLGQSTDSHDAEGEVMEEMPVPELSEDKIVEIMESFHGDQYQTPPMFSAKKINGVPLYKMARKGKTVEREPRFIRISSFELDDFRQPDEIDFTVAVSKGTYIRVIAHDFGKKIDSCSHLTALRRTEIENFVIEESVPLSEFEELSAEEIKKELIPPYKAVPSNIVS